MSGILKVGGSELINDNGGSGALQWGSGVPAGSIINFNYADNHTELSGITEDSWITTGLSVAIRPKQNNSKIYVIGTWGATVLNNEHVAYKVVRTGPSSQDLGIQVTYNSTGWMNGVSSYASIDTPSSTAECTYTLFMYVNTTSSNCLWNYDDGFTPSANLMVMEITQ